MNSDRSPEKCVDVVMCTWNSARNSAQARYPWFRRCLESIEHEIPVHCFILVDRFSQDDTVSVIKDVFPSAVVIQTDSNLARQRSLGIKRVDTDWFLFCDDDIEFTEGWYSKITSYVKNNIGALNGWAVPPYPRLIRSLYSTNNIWYGMRKRRVASRHKAKTDSQRGLGGNTLVRTSLVSDWNPPPMLGSFEDHHLRRHIIRKGAEWLVVPQAIAWHHRQCTVKTMFIHERWNAAGGRLIGAMSLQKIIKEAVIGTLAGLYLASNSGVAEAIPLSIAQHLGRFQGYLKWKDFLVLER